VECACGWLVDGPTCHRGPLLVSASGNTICRDGASLKICREIPGKSPTSPPGVPYPGPGTASPRERERPPAAVAGGLESHAEAALLVVLIVAGQPGGQPVDGGLELRVQVGEGPQLLGEPRQADLLLAAALLQLLDSAIGEVHRRPASGGRREDRVHQSLLL